MRLVFHEDIGAMQGKTSFFGNTRTHVDVEAKRFGQCRVFTHPNRGYPAFTKVKKNDPNTPGKKIDDYWETSQKEPTMFSESREFYRA